ncbi:MAG: BamA/TamA family outer membrane protein, partial [Cytophagales bacterium]
PRASQHRQYHVDSVSITTDVGRKLTGKLKRLSEPYENMTFNYFVPEYNKKILAQRVFIKRDSLYSRTKTINTQRQLANLDIFKFVNVNYDTAALRGKMVANLFMSALDKYSWSNEAGVTVTQGFPGPYISTSLKKRNLFGGLEILELGGRFGFEGVASATEVGNFYQSTEASANAAITFPQFLFPFSRAASFRYAKYNPRTRLSAGYTYTDRPEYQRRITTVSAAFSWDINQKFQFTFTPTNINIINSTFGSSALGSQFEKLLDSLQNTQGNNLRNAFLPSFVGSMIFSFTWNNNYGSSQKSSSLLRTTLESGGTILNLFTPQFIVNQGLQPFQYLRFNVDFRKNVVINKKTSFAWRINTGVGYAYSANRVLPYEKNFFAGGSNSLRAWRPRRLGVGSEPPQLSENPASNGYFDYRFEKPGDLLIEGSMEWRQKLIGFINYALFVDAGNVWSLRTTSKPEAQFNWSNFYEEFAVGTGFGIRFDFSFLILRLDVGIKAWDPARPAGQRWVLNRVAFGGPYGLDREPVIYNIGIGYPF